MTIFFINKVMQNNKGGDLTPQEKKKIATKYFNVEFVI